MGGVGKRIDRATRRVALTGVGTGACPYAGRLKDSGV